MNSRLSLAATAMGSTLAGSCWKISNRLMLTDDAFLVATFSIVCRSVARQNFEGALPFCEQFRRWFAKPVLVRWVAQGNERADRKIGDGLFSSNHMLCVFRGLHSACILDCSLLSCD